MKTVIPRRAAAKLDVRLVADQDPHEVFDLLATFLRDRDIQTDCLAAVPPSSTPIEGPYTSTLRRAVHAAWDVEPLLQPCLGGTTPDFVFSRILGVPSLLVPYAPADMQHHASDEHLDLEALHRGVRTSASICLELAAAVATETG